MEELQKKLDMIQILARANRVGLEDTDRSDAQTMIMNERLDRVVEMLTSEPFMPFESVFLPMIMYCIPGYKENFVQNSKLEDLD